MPVKAFPGQDHEAHLAVHLAYMQSPLFGSNTIIATKYLPAMLQHIAEHVALWYANAMLEAANAALRAKTGQTDLTIEGMASPEYEAPLDRMLAELTPEVMTHANESLGDMPAVIAQAQMLMQRLAPQGPMDPSVVAMKDVERQGQADQQNAQLKLVAENNKKEAAGMKTQADLQKEGMRLQDKQADRQFKAEQAEAERQQRERDSAQSAQVAAQGNELRLQGVVETNDSREAIAGLTAQAKMDANAAEIGRAHV